MEQAKIRISREILSDGPGYAVVQVPRHWSNGKDVTKRHMGRFVRVVYVPTSQEWEPPDDLMGQWWKLVNAEGKVVGLLAYIPRPEERHLYEGQMDTGPRTRVVVRHWPSICLPWERRRPRTSKLMVREDKRGWLRRLCFWKREPSPPTK